jgi:hypothetical protein
MIAGLTLLLAVSFAVGYTIRREWLNVNVRGSWAYVASMPTLPLIGTGLSPLLQWLVVPSLALRLATRRPPWSTVG